MDSETISDTLSEIAVLLELKGENPFKVRAFENGARIVSEWKEDPQTELTKAKSGSTKGLGKGLIESIEVLLSTGTLPTLAELRAEFPQAVLDMLRIPGLGAKKIKVLQSQLGVASLDDLERACLEGRVAKTKGFGEKTQEKILLGLRFVKGVLGKLLIHEGLREAGILISWLERSADCKLAVPAGEVRRYCEIISVVELLVITAKPDTIAEHLRAYERVSTAEFSSDGALEVVLANNLRARIHFADEGTFAERLFSSTGGEGFLEALSKEKLTFPKLAVSKTLDLSEIEKPIFEAAQCAYIVPERRESAGVVDEGRKLFAAGQTFPAPIALADLRGVLHAHTTYSDGRNTLRELATYVRDQGYQYLGVTDHSQSAVYARGLFESTVRKQQKEIDELNAELAPFRIFKGIESDILEDGSLDYHDALLETFDFVIASIHSRFQMSRDEMTKRVLAAVKNPYTTILGHSTGRLLLRREPFALDSKAVLRAAADHGVCVELNCDPLRCDLDWRYHALAKELGIKVPLCPDAHALEGVSNLQYGIAIARKGGLTSSDVLNCLDVEALDKFFQARKARRKS